MIRWSFLSEHCCIKSLKSANKIHFKLDILHYYHFIWVVFSPEYFFVIYLLNVSRDSFICATVKGFRLTGDLPVGLRGRLPVDDDGARFVLFAHHRHVFRGRAGNCGRVETVSM